jgi:hypothetical protein
LKYASWVGAKGTAFLCLGGLVGCESDSPANVVPEAPYFESFEAALVQGRGFSDRSDLAGDESGERPSGTVTYDGLVGISSDSTDFDDPASVAADPLSMAGRVTLSVDFADDGVMSGQASDFIDANNNQLDGTLAITQEFNTSPFAMSQLSGTAIGDITAANGQTYSIGVNFDGSFRGVDSQFVYGYGNADIVISSQIVPYTLYYIAER